MNHTNETDPPMSKVVQPLESPQFEFHPCADLAQYEKGLREIIREREFNRAFIETDYLIMDRPAQIGMLRYYCERVYTARLKQNTDVKQRALWSEILARLLYTGFYVEFLGVKDYPQVIYYHLAQPYHFQSDDVQLIDPLLAHMLVRAMCSTYLSYGRDEAKIRYALSNSRAFEAWTTLMAERAERDEQNFADLDAERRNTFYYGTIEDLNDY